jgi:maltose O-acetyltransferase
MKIDGLSEKQKMLRGDLYNATDRELVVERQHAESQLAVLNGSTDPVRRVALLRGLLGAIGEETVARSVG